MGHVFVVVSQGSRLMWGDYVTLDAADKPLSAAIVIVADE